jgi:hypothetical protein
MMVVSFQAGDRSFSLLKKWWLISAKRCFDRMPPGMFFVLLLIFDII